MTENGDTRPWYERAFDRVYREVYPHRSDEQADEEVAFAARILEPDPDLAPIFDLCCGHGRHAAAWNRRGFQVVGLDLSRDLIEQARERRLERSLFLRGDMRRLPFRDESFQLTTSFFTSFGYFEDRDEDLQVLREIRRVLIPGGRFILDFLNAVQVRKTLVSHSEAERSGYLIREARRIDEETRRVIKEVLIEDGEGRRHRYEESVRLYDQDELTRLCDEAGLEIEARHGRLAHEPFDPETSPRLVISGAKR